MKKAIAAAFLLLASVVAVPHHCIAASWTLAPGTKMKVRVTVSYPDASLGKVVRKSYRPDNVSLTLDKDDNTGVADTTIIMSGGELADLTASMHGSITTLSGMSYLSACYNSNNELTTPFNFADGVETDNDISADGIMATSVEGTFTPDKKQPGNIRLSLTYTMNGMSSGGYPLRISVTISATAQQI